MKYLITGVKEKYKQSLLRKIILSNDQDFKIEIPMEKTLDSNKFDECVEKIQPKRFLITGGSGQLGYDIFRELINRYGTGVDVILPTHEVMDITARDETINLIKTYHPDVIFHCAAFTSVESAEEDCKTCYDVNVNGTKNVRDAAESINAKLIYISTNYVFDGTKKGSYQVDDNARPINLYGQTKLLGEKLVLEYPKAFIVRTSWLFGIKGNNFIQKMLKKENEKNDIYLATDQISNPTYTVDLSKFLVRLSEDNKYGIYHASNEGYVSLYELAKYIFKEKKIDVNIIGTITDRHNTVAAYPLNSSLDNKELLKKGHPLFPSWQDAVSRYLKEITKQQKINKILGRNETDIKK